MTYAGSSGGYPNIDSDIGPTDAQIEAARLVIKAWEESGAPIQWPFADALANLREALTAAAEVGQQFNTPQDEVIASLREMGAIPPEPAAEVGPTLVQEAYAAGLEDGAIREREACARVAESWGGGMADKIAAAIRARKD